MWVPNIEFFLIAFEKKEKMCFFLGGRFPSGNRRLATLKCHALTHFVSLNL